MSGRREEIRFAAVAALVLATSACANAYMAGSETVKTPPASPTATYLVTACTEVPSGKHIDVPGGITYYLNQEASGLAVYEFDSKGNGTRWTNQWTDDAGLHFFTYIKMLGIGYELVLPPAGSGTRVVYTKGNFTLSKDEGFLRPLGTPSAQCTMSPQ